MFVCLFVLAFSLPTLSQLFSCLACISSQLHLRPISLESFILPVRGWEHHLRILLLGLHTFCYSAVTSPDIQFNGSLVFSGAILALTNFAESPDFHVG